MMKTILTAYRVGDIARSVDFYAKVGFHEIGRATFEGGTTRVWLNLPGDGEAATIELVEDPSAGRLALGNGFSHIAVQVDDLAATLADLAREDIASHGIERPGGEEGPATADLRDPDGYRIELVQWPPGHADGITSADFG
jgi:lactoylglutathione lyase